MNLNLHRAIVSLPERLSERDRYGQDRVVFFEPPRGVHAGAHLAQILTLAWGLTEDDHHAGCIYNVCAEGEVLNDYGIDDSAGDMRLFATGSGGKVGGLRFGTDPVRIHFARAADVDLFVTPRTHKRLAAALNSIEVAYARQEALA